MPIHPYSKSNSTVGTSPSTGQYLQIPTYLRKLWMGGYNLKINRFTTTQSAVSVAVFLNPTYIYGRTALTLDTHSLW